MITNNKIFILLFLWLCLNDNAFAQKNWELKKNDSGISIYTSEVKGSEFKAFKSVTKFSASGLNEVVAIILDVDNYKKLFPDILECKVLKKTNDGIIIHYILNKAPWPVDNREGVFELRPEYNKSQKEVIIMDKCIEYNYPKAEGAVRMNKGEGFWKVTEIKNNLFEITYQFHADPAGKIPAWLANSFVVDQPYKTLLNLKSIIEGGSYKNSKVSFLE